MAIRIRTENGVPTVAICAARSIAKPGDIYLDDQAHFVLADKFREDFKAEGLFPLSVDAELAERRLVEESNNPARTWWDRTYVAITPSEADTDLIERRTGVDDDIIN